MKYHTDHFTELDNGQLVAIWNRIKLDGNHWVWTGGRNSITGLPVHYRRGNSGSDISVGRWLFDMLLLRPFGLSVVWRVHVRRLCDRELCVNPHHHGTVADPARMRQAFKNLEN